MGRLDGKVAIVTGAGSGMGASEAKLFAKEGAKVVVTDIEYDAVKEVVQEIKDSGGDAIAIEHDVAKEEDWKKVVDETKSHYDKVDILVNNAGVFGKQGFDPIEKVEKDEWDKVMSINGLGVFLGVKAVAEEMKKNKSGSIVNVSSIAALVGGAGGTHYTASKGAVRSLTKQVALEFGESNIRVNSLHPGMIETPLIDDVSSEQKENIISLIPLQRMGTDEEVAYAALFLASDESSFITASELVVDGGETGTQN